MKSKTRKTGLDRLVRRLRAQARAYRQRDKIVRNADPVSGNNWRSVANDIERILNEVTP